MTLMHDISPGPRQKPETRLARFMKKPFAAAARMLTAEVLILALVIPSGIFAAVTLNKTLKTRTETGLLAHYTFDGASPLADASGNGNTLTHGTTDDPTVVFLTSGTSYSRPADWNDSNNSIECLGPGGDGTTDDVRGGAGGGAYAKITNFTMDSSEAIVIGTGGSGISTSFGTDLDCVADAGNNPTSATGAAGGTTAASTGTTEYAGGNGGDGISAGGNGGGGGSAGPSGAGQDGGDGHTSDGSGGGGGANGGSSTAGTASPGTDGGAGGAGDDGTGGGTGGVGADGGDATAGKGAGGGGGANDFSGGDGSIDAAWDATHGAGGGGGGIGKSSPAGKRAGDAGTYGGGGGGGDGSDGAVGQGGEGSNVVY